MSVLLKNGIRVGKGENTVLSVLLGFNTIWERTEAFDKLEYLSRNHSSDITIVGDVSMYKSGTDSAIWRSVLCETSFAAASVPVYQAFRKDGIIDRTELRELIQEQAESGVSIIIIHPTPSHELHALSQTRIIPCVSRGGTMVYSDMCKSNRYENIYLNELDTIASIAYRNNTVLSIGTTYRSGSIIDAFDELYQKELEEQIYLSSYLQSRGVETIIETPGHADASAISEICNRLCNIKEPIMPLGPLPTDTAYEYDDLAACIGAALMGVKGCADILTVVTSAEHAGGIPSLDVLCEAIRKYRVAAHIIDLQKTGDNSTDRFVSLLRRNNKSCVVKTQERCMRCSEACPLRIQLDR